MADANYSPTLQASSALRKSGMSITLPRNFAPLSLDNGVNEPRTPDQTFAELNLPPPLAHSTYRVRRPRLMMDNFQARNNALPATLFASDIPPFASSPFRLRPDVTRPMTALGSDDPLPSIELHPALERPVLTRGSSEPLNTGHLKAPSSTEQVPSTPTGQTRLTTPDLKGGNWDMQRAASVCSVHSDSSISSDESFGTRPTSFDGSTTSPDCDSQDPFSLHLVNVIPDTPTRRRKKMRINTSFSKDNIEWSIEMDNHLFNVYQMYLADPTVTPFKTVPGSIPPTGVCHRVARRARETWPRASRIAVPIIKRYRVRNLLDIRRSMRDKTPDPEDFLKTDNAASLGETSSNLWPSESSTRRRLKQLCREKFTITAHYQRLRESRSPSPFSDQFLRRPVSRLGRTTSTPDEPSEQAGTYTTRELGISLVANDATAPLVQLMSEDAPSESTSVDDWFNQPLKPTDTMNLTTPTTSSTQLDRLAPAAAQIPRLASPFNYSTWNGPSTKHVHRRHISHGQYDTMHATGTRLLSPFQRDGQTGVNTNKRRAQHNLEDELSPRGSDLGFDANAMNLDGAPDTSTPYPNLQALPNLIFTGTGDINQRRIRMRNRGATLGAAVCTGGPERIESLFTPPPIQTAEVGSVPPLVAFPTPSSTAQSTESQMMDAAPNLAVPQVEPAQRRLGSPFELDPNKRSLRMKNARHVPSLSDPFISIDHFGLHSDTEANHVRPAVGNIGNIGERLAMFGNLHAIDRTPQ